MKHKIVQKTMDGREILCIYEKKDLFSSWEYKESFYSNYFQENGLESARDWITNRFKKDRVLEVYKNGKRVV